MNAQHPAESDPAAARPASSVVGPTDGSPSVEKRPWWRWRSVRQSDRHPLLSNVISSLALLASLGTFLWTQHTQGTGEELQRSQQRRTELERLLEQYQNLSAEFVEQSKGLAPSSPEFAALQSRMANRGWSIAVRCEEVVATMPDEEISAFHLGVIGNLAMDTSHYQSAQEYLTRAIAKANQPLLRAAMRKDLGRLHYLRSPLHDHVQGGRHFEEAIAEAGVDDVGAKSQTAFFYETWGVVGIQDDGLEASRSRLAEARRLYEELWTAGLLPAKDAQLRVDQVIATLDARQDTIARANHP